MNYYISDLHLFHENSIKFDNRPFENVEDMHESIRTTNLNTDDFPPDEIKILYAKLKRTPFVRQIKSNERG